jgi:hypothetical protein
MPRIPIVDGNPTASTILVPKNGLGVTKSDEQTALGVNKGERFQVPRPGRLNGTACKPRVTSDLSRVATGWELVSEMHNKQAQKRIPVSMPRLFSLY